LVTGAAGPVFSRQKEAIVFAIPGPEFLVIYLVLCLIGAVGYRVIRRRLRASSRPIYTMEPLSPVMVGYLVSGATRAGAVAAVVRKDLDPSTRSHRYDPDEIDQVLADQGLILSDREANSLRYLGSAIFGGLLAAGIARLLVGLSHQRPSGLLMLLLVIVAGGLLAVARTTVIRTMAGNQVVDDLMARAHVDRDDSDVAMNFALLGWTALIHQPELQGYLQSVGFSPASLGGGTSDGGGTSLGGGTSDGGGGCGSGGCGGCGGCGS
jgi:hypothetical protein